MTNYCLLNYNNNQFTNIIIYLFYFKGIEFTLKLLNTQYTYI